MTKTDIPQSETAELSITLPVSYVHLNKKKEAPVLILLHGYADSGPSFLRRILPSLDDQFEILAPNGFFPLPQRIENGWREAYAWYFSDSSKNRVLIPPEVAAAGAQQLIERLGLKERPKILIGFSQGGFFLPKLAAHLENLRYFIAIGSGFRPQDYAKIGKLVPITGLHGDEDEVVPMGEAKSQFETLEKDQQREFHIVKGMGHSIDDAGREKLRQILLEMV